MVVAVLSLALLGAGGFAGYRYVSLGYVLEPPPPEPVELAFEIQPATALIEVDGRPVRVRPVRA